MRARYTTLLLSFAALPHALHAQPGTGAPYGARDPRPCPSVQATATRPPDAATATAFVICRAEHLDVFKNLYLLRNVRVQVGGGTPYRELPFSARPVGAVDPTATVYAIRGSYTSFQCQPVVQGRAGQNCTQYDVPRAEGRCFRDNFGEWQCSLGGDAVPQFGTDKQSPPQN